MMQLKPMYSNIVEHRRSYSVWMNPQTVLAATISQKQYWSYPEIVDANFANL